MPIMRIKEIAAMSSEDREKKLTELRVELARVKTMINAGGAVEDPTRVRLLRKTIAQILTVQNEQKLGLREAPKEPEKKEKPKAKPAKKVKKETAKEEASQ
ncbi:MAG: 50S ribosomal protein L29 [Candidatus Bathyarchaeota archaeon]|jgi:large subunit ribosomal protein L29|nr:50S ribosomal protein L29 [Candidatus Bathyarchaeota archaeon]